VANWKGKNWITKGTNGGNKNIDGELKESGWFIVHLIWEEAGNDITNGSV
jgi:hypothetical protein